MTATRINWWNVVWSMSENEAPTSGNSAINSGSARQCTRHRPDKPTATVSSTDDHLALEFLRMGRALYCHVGLMSYKRYHITLRESRAMMKEQAIKARSVLFFLAVLGWAGLGVAHAACSDLSVTNAWVRAAPPGVPVMAGYFSVHNDGTADVRLTGVDSAQFGRAQMHRSTVDDQGMSHMQRVTAVTVPAGETLAFAPGGYHLMLFEPTQSLALGDSVSWTLQCDDEGTLAVTAEVRSRAPADS